MFVNLCRLLREKLHLGPDAPVGAASAASSSTGAGSDHKLAAEAALARAGAGITWTPNLDTSLKEPRATVLIPGARIRYLAEIAEQGRAINAGIEKQAEAADRAQACWQALQELGDDKLPKQLDLYGNEALLPPAGEEARKRSDEHTSELQSLMRISYAVFC